MEGFRVMEIRGTEEKAHASGGTGVWNSPRSTMPDPSLALRKTEIKEDSIPIVSIK